MLGDPRATQDKITSSPRLNIPGWFTVKLWKNNPV